MTDLVPVNRDEFFTAVAPCLTLAAGVGMSPGDQDAWLEAAFLALEGVPIALLVRGTRAAMASADHPSKIVPAIMAEIGSSWNWRRKWWRENGRAEFGSPPTDERANFVPCTPEQAKAILAEFGLQSAFPSNREERN